MECKECLALVEDYYDDTLDTETKQQISEHMETCPLCGAELDDLREAMQFFKDNIPFLTLERPFTERVMMNIASVEEIGPFAVPIFGMGTGMVFLIVAILALIGPILGRTLLLIGEFLSGLLNSFAIALGEYYIPQAAFISVLALSFVCVMATMRRVAAYGGESS